MPKVKYAAQVSVVYLTCAECATQMQANGEMLPTDPPLYTLVCPSCGHIERLHDPYPRIVYEYRVPRYPQFLKQFVSSFVAAIAYCSTKIAHALGGQDETV